MVIAKESGSNGLVAGEGVAFLGNLYIWGFSRRSHRKGFATNVVCGTWHHIRIRSHPNEITLVEMM